MSEQVNQSENALTVSTLAALLTQALSEFFPKAVTLDAEITNFKTYHPATGTSRSQTAIRHLAQ